MNRPHNRETEAEILRVVSENPGCAVTIASNGTVSPCFTSAAAIESTSWEWYCDALAKATVLAACKKQSNQPTTPELDTKAIYRDAYARLWNEQLALQSA